MRKNILVALLFLVSIPFFSDAQRVRARWKAYRIEWDAGVGASNFLGELGGANQIGTNGFKDLEFSLTRPTLAAGIRYKFTPFIAIHPHITVGQVRGDDALTEEYFRNRRNLNFRSMIYEVNCNVEFSILSQKEGGIYKLRGIKRSSSYEVSAYAFTGIGLFHFNPQGELDGKWVNLQPLGTEGQGISPARKKYPLTQVCIPVGFGFRYFFSRRMGIGIEYGIRKTFTDYIDDVSKTYYDKAAIQSANGSEAAMLSDKSIEGIGTDEQRGDPRDKDAYMFAVFSFHYKIRTGRTNFPIF